MLPSFGIDEPQLRVAVHPLLVVGRSEEDRGAVRRPRDATLGGLVVRETTQFTGLHVGQVDLVQEGVVAPIAVAGREGDPPSIRGDVPTPHEELLLRDLARLLRGHVEDPEVLPLVRGLPVGTFIDEDRIRALLLFLGDRIGLLVVRLEEDRRFVFGPFVGAHTRGMFGQLDGLASGHPHCEDLLFAGGPLTHRAAEAQPRSTRRELKAATAVLTDEAITIRSIGGHAPILRLVLVLVPIERTTRVQHPTTVRGYQRAPDRNHVEGVVDGHCSSSDRSVLDGRRAVLRGGGSGGDEDRREDDVGSAENEVTHGMVARHEEENGRGIAGAERQPR
jgi:hypothetical protein